MHGGKGDGAMILYVRLTIEEEKAMMLYVRLTIEEKL
jgi:hypothetical protein